MTDNKNNTLAERLTFALEKRNMKAADLCRANPKLKSGRVSQISTGKNTNPTGETLTILARGLCVNLEWLMNGLGEMDPSSVDAAFPTPSHIPQFNGQPLDLDKDVMDIVYRYQDLDEDLRKEVEDHIKEVWHRQRIRSIKS